MNITGLVTRLLPYFMTCLAGPAAFCAGTEITNLDVAPDGDTVRITVQLTAPAKPNFWAINQPCRLIFDFPGVMVENQPRRISINDSGISEAVVETIHGARSMARISVGVDTLRRFGIKTSGNTVVLTVLPQPLMKNDTCGDTPAAKTRLASSVGLTTSRDDRVTPTGLDREAAIKMLAKLSTNSPLEVTHVTSASGIDALSVDNPSTVRQRFEIKFVSGKTAYINGGSNAGLRVGMNLDIRKAAANFHKDGQDDTPIAAARIIGIATTSAILEIGSSSGDCEVGDSADLLPRDAEAARQNVITGPDNTLHARARPVNDDADASAPLVGQRFRSTQEPNEDTRTRTAGRIGLDYSGISSSGSTPGVSTQLGMSFQSDIRHIFGTHWNLEGYWRGRVTRHSQFLEPTIDDSLNKTYTMQLYYDNPSSRWVAGAGRLYLPWAVSLDTVDGGYFGGKFPLHNTTGVFAGSTPDLSSWHYRPNQRIGGVFTNFEGGDYDRFHYSSTTGAALTSIKWKLDPR